MIVLTQRNKTYVFDERRFRFFFQEVERISAISDVRTFIREIDEIGDGIFNKEP